MVLREPAPRFLGIGARVDGFAAEIDAAFEQLPAAAEPPRESALVTDGSAPATSRRFAYAVAQAPRSHARSGRGPPVRTTAASVGAASAGAGLPSVNANRTKPSA